MGWSNWLWAPVTQIVLRALPFDISVLTPAILISWVSGAYIGVKSVRGRIRILLPIFYALNSAPMFWVAMLLILLFSTYLGLVPPTGTPYSVLPSLTTRYIVVYIRHWFLPFLSATVVLVGFWAVQARQSAVGEMNNGYMKYGEAVGLRADILDRYLFRNTMMGSLAVLAIYLGSIIGGNAVLEAMFQYPGVGYLAQQALLRGDLALARGVFLAMSFMVLAANLIIDLVLERPPWTTQEQ
ncbi:MAG: ABC transporter permease subunit [Thermoproteus sp. AZ2]|uniref:ABC transporter permease subunit n=1 Tax=Thermoproteus sp. AZ2 TaxID=1609232 RepID=A0ACC6UZW7_9CREN